jgi:hypothetical protein
VPGVSLSRWTMAYFAAALAALLLAEVLMAAGYGYPSAPVQSPQTLVVVHIVTIGWLSLLMCGALFQFVPVLINRPLFDNFLPMPTLLCLLGGLVGLLSGFLWFEGQIEDTLPFFPIASILLGLGFVLVVWNLAGTLMSGWPLPLPARFVAAGLAGVSFTSALGIVFALVRGGVVDNAYLVDLTARGVPLHVIAGLGGWLTLSAMGVSYRLFSMFMLAAELDRQGTRLALHLAVCALVIAVPGGILALLTGRNLDPILLATSAAGLIGLGFYGRDILHLYRTRKRRTIELNTRMGALAFASLGLAILLAAILVAFGTLERRSAVIVFLAAFGWLSGLGLAKLYKIVPFMTWLECYGPVLGKKATPRVQDLIVEKRAGKWFLLYFTSVWGGTAALLYGDPPVFQAAAATMFVATAGIIVQLLRARRLVDVRASARFPEGAHRPALFYSFTQRT